MLVECRTSHLDTGPHANTFWYLKFLSLFSVFCWYSFPRHPLIGQKGNAPSFSQTLMKRQSPHSVEQMISIKLQSTLRDFDIQLKWIGGREMTAIKRISHHRALKSCCQKSADKNIMPIMGKKKNGCWVWILWAPKIPFYWNGDRNFTDIAKPRQMKPNLDILLCVFRVNWPFNVLLYKVNLLHLEKKNWPRVPKLEKDSRHTHQLYEGRSRSLR